MDVDKALRMAVESGKVEFGTRSGLRSAAKAKLVLVSSNCPSATRKKVEALCGKSGVALQAYRGTSVEIGAVCGKPFPISVLAVLEPGTSNILEMGKAASDSVPAHAHAAGGEKKASEAAAGPAEQAPEAQG